MTGAAPPGGPLRRDELRQLLLLLARYCAHDVDQWENWRVEGPYGPVYVSITNKLMPGVPDEAFRTVWPLPASSAWETGRAADVNPDTVSTSRHLAIYVQAMREDLLAHPNKWENGTLERFLDALSGYLDGRTDVLEPSWTTFAKLLRIASGYE